MKNNTPEWLLVIIVIVLLIVAFFGRSESQVQEAEIVTDDIKVSKQDLAKKYGISRPTLKKWVKYFLPDVEIGTWNKMRYLTQSDVMAFEIMLGNEYSLALNKAQIAKQADSNYKVVADNVIRNLDRVGITLEAWNSCSCFPPVITNRILEMLG